MKRPLFKHENLPLEFTNLQLMEGISYGIYEIGFSAENDKSKMFGPFFGFTAF